MIYDQMKCINSNSNRPFTHTNRPLYFSGKMMHNFKGAPFSNLLFCTSNVACCIFRPAFGWIFGNLVEPEIIHNMFTLKKKTGFQILQSIQLVLHEKFWVPLNCCWVIALKNLFLKNFAIKNTENDYLDKRLACAAPKWRLKYATVATQLVTLTFWHFKPCYVQNKPCFLLKCSCF